MTPIAIPPDARILVVALRRLGDVLLTTPLMRSLKRAFRCLHRRAGVRGHGRNTDRKSGYRRRRDDA